MRRLARAGFLQQHIWPFFGYYPWECPICRKLRLVRCRRRRGVRLESGGVPRT